MVNNNCATGLALVAILMASSHYVLAETSTTSYGISGLATPLERLEQSIRAVASSQPNAFDPTDLKNFLEHRHATSALRFLVQRNQNSRRAARLAIRALVWRREMGLNQLDASHFPCDLFKLGLIFESGRAHQQVADGRFVETNPVIWIRLGALGGIIKQLEKAIPARVVSRVYKTPRSAMRSVQSAIKHVRRRHHRLAARAERELNKHQRALKNLSAKSNESLREVLKSMAWWLDNWVKEHPDTKATLVLDFEDTDFAFASWSMGEFFVKLDDLFPALFDQIIGFRYKPKLWSLHSPISMFNRIFKSRVSSSPETDRKLKFVTSEPQIGTYMPRVDSLGFTMLPEHVSGYCVSPDDSKAPARCQSDLTESEGLYNARFWQVIYNQFYYQCKPKARV